MTSLPDTSITQLIANDQQIKSICDSSLALLNLNGTVWSRSGVANNPLFSNGDLSVAATSSAGHLVRASAVFPPSNRYGKVQVPVVGSPGYFGIGIIAAGQSLFNPPVSLAAVPPGLWVWRSDGWTANNGNAQSKPISFGNGAILALYHNTFGEVYGNLNGTWIGDPIARTNPLFTGVSGDLVGYTMALVFFGNAGSPSAIGNFTTADGPVGSQLYA